MVQLVPGSFQVPLARSKYHLLTGLLRLLRQHTPSGKQLRTIALNRMSATPPAPWLRFRTANLSRYGTNRALSSSDTPAGLSHVNRAPPSYSPAMITPAILSLTRLR